MNRFRITWSLRTFSMLAALIELQRNVRSSRSSMSLYLQNVKKDLTQDHGIIMVAQPVVWVFSPFAGKLSIRSSRDGGSAGCLYDSRSDYFELSWIRDIRRIYCGKSYHTRFRVRHLFSSPNANAVMSSLRKGFTV